MDHKKIIFGIVVVILLIFSFCVTNSIQTSDQAEIQKWGKENGYVIITSERSFFNYGPYWIVAKNDRVYKVDLENDQTYWFRFRFWGIDIEKEN